MGHVGAHAAALESTPAGRLCEIQRARLLAGALSTIEEVGYSGATVAQITSRARVSRRTFYELFDNREECLLALIKDFAAMLEGEIARADLDALPWRERVRTGLLVILSVLDRVPTLARVCVIQSQWGGPRVLELRETLHTRLAAVLDEGCEHGARAGGCTSLTAEGLVGAAFGIVYARLLRRDPKPLTGLLGELMAMIVLPYQGLAAARREQTRVVVPQAAPVVPSQPSATVAEGDPLCDIPMRLTYRTARVLEGIAERPGISNRQVADYAGVSDPGQISKLLARLERLGLAANGGDGRQRGEPNAWRLTPKGVALTHSILGHVDIARNGRAI